MYKFSPSKKQNGLSMSQSPDTKRIATNNLNQIQKK